MRIETLQDRQRYPAQSLRSCPADGVRQAPDPVRICAIGTPGPRLAHTLFLAGAVLIPDLETGPALAGLEAARLPDVFICCPGPVAGLAVVELIRLVAVRRPTLVVGLPRWRHASAAIAAGAVAYLVEDTPASGPGLSSLIAALAAHRHPAPDQIRPALAQLSHREREALTYIAAGYTHKQAARQMAISKATVDTYVQRIRAKVGVGNKADLTRMAMVEADCRRSGFASSDRLCGQRRAGRRAVKR